MKKKIIIIIACILAYSPCSNAMSNIFKRSWQTIQEKANDAYTFCKDHKKEIALGCATIAGYHFAKKRSISRGFVSHKEWFKAVELPMLTQLFALIPTYYSIKKLMDGGFFNNKEYYSRELPRTTRADIAGPIPPQIDQLITMIKEPERFQQRNIAFPRGILLYGPPGTGKTLLARAIAGECQCPFFHTVGSHFNGQIRGSGTLKIMQLFRTAQRYATPERPAIVFIDEFDALAAQRAQHAFNSRDDNATINTLLAAMDGFALRKNIIIIAATNSADALDRAVTRPGRFDYLIEIGLPTRQTRQALWNHYLERTFPDAAFDDAILNTLVNHSNLMTGADIQTITANANRSAAFENIEINDQLLADAFNDHVYERNVGTLIEPEQEPSAPNTPLENQHGLELSASVNSMWNQYYWNQSSSQ